MKCNECRELMVAYLKQELDENQVGQFEEHIAQCTDCQTELEGARKVAVVLDQADEEPAVRIANTMMEHGIKRRASDIHIQPLPDKTVIRYRIDGVLDDAIIIPRYMLDPLVARVKMMADTGACTSATRTRTTTCACPSSRRYWASPWSSASSTRPR